MGIEEYSPSGGAPKRGRVGTECGIQYRSDNPDREAPVGIGISNNSSFRQKRRGVPDGSDGSDGTSYPLTENYTLPVVQATGRVAYVLLYFVVTFTHHQKDTCVTLFAGAAVMLKPFTQRLAMLNHSYYLSFNDLQNLCIQFVFSSMYLCTSAKCILVTGSLQECLRGCGE